MVSNKYTVTSIKINVIHWHNQMKYAVMIVLVKMYLNFTFKNE